jgi:hypothetical protein
MPESTKAAEIDRNAVRMGHHPPETIGRRYSRQER